MQLLDEDSSYSLRQLAQRIGIGDYEVLFDTAPDTMCQLFRKSF